MAEWKEEGITMNVATLEALKGSIKKWEKIVDGTGVDNGADNCPLCKLFVMERCKDCPVYKETEEIFCRETPFMEFLGECVYENGIFIGRKAVTNKQKKIAQLEVDFLKSLLPAVKGD